MDVCVTTRAKNSTVYKGEAAYGYCAAKKKSFYSFQGHLMTDARSIHIAMTITAANIDERISIYDLLHNVDGLLMVEDKLSNYGELTQASNTSDIQAFAEQ